ncbi:MAG TPA: hypothetical protein VGH53_16520 [Streptosporangiaceae bacterium]
MTSSFARPLPSEPSRTGLAITLASQQGQPKPRIAAARTPAGQVSQPGPDRAALAL